jgi:hypothetical protein
MRDQNGSVMIIFRDERFLGVRIFVLAFLICALGFLVDAFVWRTLGLIIFFAGWAIAVVGFFVHLSRWRRPKE